MAQRVEIRIAGSNRSSETLPLFKIMTEQNATGTTDRKTNHVSGFWPGLIPHDKSSAFDFV